MMESIAFSQSVNKPETYKTESYSLYFDKSKLDKTQLIIDESYILDFNHYNVFELYLNIDNETSIRVPENLRKLIEPIKKSRYILNLKDDWDDEGSEGYEKETWEKSVNFIINYAQWIFKNYNTLMYLPKIYHGKKGGIDILWENSKFRMLIRIDKNVENAVYYAENKKMQTSEGEFKIDDVNYLMLPTPIDF